MISAAVLAFLATGTVAHADYEAPTVPAYQPPATYYNYVNATDGTTLMSQLYTLTNIGTYTGANTTTISLVTYENYGDQRYSMGSGTTNGPIVGGYTDVNPGDNGSISVLYGSPTVTTGSVNVGSVNVEDALWKSGTTWNREHVWPKYWLNVTSTQVSDTYKGVASDMFELRPADMNVNSARSNFPYGAAHINSSSLTTGAGVATLVSGKANTRFFYPGDLDKGDISRELFYMATRYSTFTDKTNGNTTQHLTLVNFDGTGSFSDGTGTLDRYTMGDKASLLRWNYEDGVDNSERRRNAYIYGKSATSSTFDLSPDYHQNNRNPFVDHPEYVWAIFGTSLNDAQIYVGATTATGATTGTVDLGRVMKNGTIGTGSFTLSKSGADPTTYDVTQAGEATTSSAGAGQPFQYGPAVITKQVPVGLTSSTATVGLKTGTVTINDTDLTSAAAGKGSQDGNDSVLVQAAVLAQRTVSVGGPTLAIGRTIRGQTFGATAGFTTTGDDNSATRVNLAASSAVDSNGLSLTSSTGSTLFNSATASAARTVAGSFSATGVKSGTLSLAVTTAENGGAGLTGEGAYGSIAVPYTATALDKRVITSSTNLTSLGNVIRNRAFAAAATFSTTGDDNNATRVYLAASSGTANGIAVAGSGSTLFNAATSTVTRSVVGSFTTVGAKSGSLTTAVTTAENGGAGLTGETAYTAVASNYAATVYDPSNASFAGTSDTNSISIDFGVIELGTGSVVSPQALYDLTLGGTTPIGLDIDGVASTGSGNAQFTSSLVPTANAVGNGGGSLGFNMNFLASQSGSFSATYLVGLSDSNSAINASAAGSEQLTINVTGRAYSKQWITDGNGTWESAANWVGGVPNNATAAANFLNLISGPRTVTLNSSKTVGTLTFDSLNSYTLAAGSEVYLALNSPAPSSYVSVASGNHTVAVPTILTINSTMVINPNSSLSFTNGITGTSSNINLSGGGTLALANANVRAITQTAGTLALAGANTVGTINSTGTVTIAQSGGLTAKSIHAGTLVLATNASATITFSSPAGSEANSGNDAYVTVVRSLDLGPISAIAVGGNAPTATATLDLTNNDLILNAQAGDLIETLSPLQYVRAAVAAAYDGASWDNAGITSSTAVSSSGKQGLGVMSGQEYLNLYDTGDGATFDGVPVTADMVLVKYTWAGDANFDGIEDTSDLSVLSGGLGSNPLKDWSTGDFNYDGVIDTADLSILSGSINNFGHLPEPTAIGAVVLGASILLERRRRFSPRCVQG